MRVQIASDLHLEHLSEEFPGYTGVVAHPEAQALILAGDIHSGAKAVALFADWPVPVLYVPGNHEAYGYDRLTMLSQLKTAAEGTSVHVLNRGSAVLDGVRFLGATLWTDYKALKDQKRGMEDARQIADHREIFELLEPFTPAAALRAHQQDKAWLAKQLALPFDGATVVITHHAPLRQSLDEEHRLVHLGPAMGSHLPSLVKKARLWVHGHVHDSQDYQAFGCRVVCNPHGYVRGLSFVDTPDQITPENESYQRSWVLTV